MAKLGGLKRHNSYKFRKKHLELCKELVTTVTLEKTLFSIVKPLTKQLLESTDSIKKDA